MVNLPHLTTRELQVLDLISDELSSDEIANKLRLSIHTVTTHRKKMLTKLGVKNTAGLIRKGFELGYLRLLNQS